MRLFGWFRKPPANAGLKDFVLSDKNIAEAQSVSGAKRQIVYKDPKIAELVKLVPIYKGRGVHNLGDIVRFANGAIGQVVALSGFKQVIFISPAANLEMLAKMTAISDHQRLMDMNWPQRTAADFRPRLQKIFVELGYLPEVQNKIDPLACQKLLATRDFKLRYYQQIVSSALIYGPYRGMLLFHSPGAGKTCTSIAMVENFLRSIEVEKETSNNTSIVTKTTTKAPPRVLMVIPPVKSLDENFRAELARCPSKLKQEIEAGRARAVKIDPANRIINSYLQVISYVSLANRVKKGQLSLENTLMVMDESHNFLVPPKQYEKAYAYLREAIMKTKNCKIALLTATPIYRSGTDLTRLVNMLKSKDEPKLPETEKELYSKFFDNGVLKRDQFIKELQGYISFYTTENDQSLFAKKVFVLPKIVKATDDHYKRFLESEKTDLKQYGITETDIPQLAKSGNAKFKNPQNGYFKRSSATTNIPISYKRANKWPMKFYALLEELQKDPHAKHFIWSRHASQGANAIGEFLVQQGWVRQSWNKGDHGSNAPKINGTLGKELAAIRNAKISADEKTTKTKALFASNNPKPYYGFVVLNKDTSQREISNSRELFNHPLNIDGKIARVFIGDEKFSEGVSLYATTHVHLFDCPSELMAYKQIVARACRLCSHVAIPWPWTISISSYVTNKDELHLMADEMLQNYQKESAVLLTQIIEATETAALENGLEKLVGSKPAAQITLWSRLVKLFSRSKIQQEST